MASILIIDDYGDSADALARLLRLCGHMVATAASGESALKILDAITPDVILLDVVMPGMNGLELAERVRTRANVPKIIGMTGVSEHDSNSFPPVFDCFLRKPVKLDELRRHLGPVAADPSTVQGDGRGV